jgi:hypothetical protein
LEQHKPSFDAEYLSFLDQRKQAKMQWVQDPRQSNVDNPNSVRSAAWRHFRGGGKNLYRASLTLRKVTSLELI